MDKKEYLKEVSRQLDNSTIYHKLESNPTDSIKNRISNILRRYTAAGVLDMKTCVYLTNDHPVTPVFYILPKIHKNLEHPPGQPIVAATNSILSPISIFLEKVLTPHIRSTRSFLLDTGAFLNIIRSMGHIPPDAILVSLDVKDLYTSIPHTEGINSVKKLLTTARPDHRQIDLCIELLTVVLDSNHFLFQDQFFLQIRGTAMGSNVAPPYANCYMADFEESHIYPNTRFQDNVLLWKRYIDNIFCVWGGTLESLLSFFEFLNATWPGITFTMSHDLHRMNFLDTVVIKDSNGALSTDLHTKDTDRNSLLHYDSLHPHAVKRSIPRSQIQRVSRIVSDDNLRAQRVSEMKTKFQSRGYPTSVLDDTQRTPHETRQNKDRIPFVHSFHPYAYILHRKIRQHWHLLATAHPNIREFREPFLPCFRRARNIRDTLIRADMGAGKNHSKQRFLQNPKYGTFPCLHCNQCSNVLRGSSFNHPHSGKSFPIKHYYTCDSTHVVYLIKCPCGVLYVGETTQRIHERISKHKVDHQV
ncbi:uncharacterized protein LOC143807448 [Ranitomeya variabilis]|uniref:uncharacterized protein LOC143807448 n=1 Tax=Ranitomeya variabilis TaxID=490064 RepID=UPI004055F8B1